MIKTLYRQIGEYWKASLLTPVWTALEVVMDVLIPYVTASLIDKGINAGSMEHVYYYGAVMILMAFLSLGFGILAGRSVAYAASGFAANLRKAMYRNIQRFAFSDIACSVPADTQYRDVSGHRRATVCHLHRGYGGAELFTVQHHLASGTAVPAGV